MHAEADGARRVAVAEQLRDLAVRHDASARNAPDHFVNALAILRISLFQLFSTPLALVRRRPGYFLNVTASRSVHIDLLEPG